MWHDMMGWGPGWGGFGLLHLLWWVFIAVLVVAVVRWGMRGNRRRDDRDGEDGALSILRERYARGEIDKTEFEERRNELGR